MTNPGAPHTRVLLIGPFPPPIGGDTVLTAHLAACECWERNGIRIDTINTSAGDRVRLPGERISSGDLLRGCRILLAALVKVPRSRVVLLWANTRFALTLGLLIVSWGRFTRRAVILKVFGGALGGRIAALPPARRAVAARLLGAVSCILVETRALARELVTESGLPADLVVHFPNYPVAPPREGPAPPRPFSGACVFFGQIKREKGVYDIIEALGGREGVRCDFFGPFLDRDRAGFLGALSKYPNLAYRGIAEPGTVSSLARAYDVLLLPTYHPGEGYPAVILEAYAAGIPVIATRWLAIPEIVEDGETGILVSPRAPAEIAAAIGSMRADPVRYERMRRRAAERSRSYTAEAIVGGVLVPRVLAYAGRKADDGKERSRDRS